MPAGQGCRSALIVRQRYGKKFGGAAARPYLFTFDAARKIRSNP